MLTTQDVVVGGCRRADKPPHKALGSGRRAVRCERNGFSETIWPCVFLGRGFCVFLAICLTAQSLLKAQQPDMPLSAGRSLKFQKLPIQTTWSTQSSADIPSLPSLDLTTVGQRSTSTHAQVDTIQSEGMNVGLAAVIVLLTSTWGQREPATGAGWRTRSGGAMGTWPRSSKEHLMIQATA